MKKSKLVAVTITYFDYQHIVLLWWFSEALEISTNPEWHIQDGRRLKIMTYLPRHVMPAAHFAAIKGTFLDVLCTLEVNSRSRGGALYFPPHSYRPLACNFKKILS